jgi:hypothetical protein
MDLQALAKVMATVSIGATSEELRAAGAATWKSGALFRCPLRNHRAASVSRVVPFSYPLVSNTGVGHHRQNEQ